ncbi:high affinity nitrate transporter NrtB [Cordyceps fumosorosea ARSEF 2679]|uniref:Nitrate/nitrite transporter n=1 Tax=Cordyceps fumosorosea (strain ARSEF 2679) TaxID=1081104 RepID=A0A162JDZ0_CORFA|nr:high affinity nitrate transporter NrtB [Cordyceps fumosorosea ARSEF 2679]OAA67542.1 high affinity nitrate transporter NrtB [Cordyceps fumosorosea ARSEF 2679]
MPRFRFSALWAAPEVCPVSKKARSIPVLNPVNVYGRVFFFSWMGFMLAFWAWYTFPPLLTVTIKKDLHLTDAQVANSNIISLIATLLLRFATGPLCDQFGARRVFFGLLLLGCLPVGLAPLVRSASGLYAARFFLGMLGATFVPCQVWCTGFFDRGVVGAANALAGGWGNAGGGITYFIMPAVFDSLVARQGMSPSEAWRVTFVVPLVCLVACGLGMMLLCPDSPVGAWGEREERIQENLRSLRTSLDGGSGSSTEVGSPKSGLATPADAYLSDEEKASKVPASLGAAAGGLSHQQAMDIAQGEVIVKPRLRDSLGVVLSPQTAFHVATYACSFGGELAINSVLSAYYKHNFPHLSQTAASNRAAIFGFLNVVTRPLGGVVADLLYRRSGGSLWWKKAWITVCGVLSGALLVVVGRVDPSATHGSSAGALVALITVMAVFLEAGNGANFALVPHVHPAANGIVSGVTGAGGNLGGVVFAVIFRFVDGGKGYATALWIIGVLHVAINLAVCWIPPLPKGQVGGR